MVLSKLLKIPNSLSQKILMAIFLIGSLATLIVSVLQFSLDYDLEMKAVEKNLDLIKKSYLKSISAAMWNMQSSQLKTALDGIVSISGIQYAAILEKEKVYINSGSLKNTKTLKRTYELKYSDSNIKEMNIGRLEVYANLDDVLAKLYKRVFIIFATQLLEIFLVSFLIYLAIQKLLTKHIEHISLYFNKLSLSNLSNVLTLPRRANIEKDELDTLVDSINEMRNNLNKSYEDLNHLNRDLEEKVEVKTELIIQQRQQLEYSAKMTILGEMAGGIAHEINNPITVISSSNRIIKKLIEKDDLNKELMLKYCNAIDRTITRITKITTGLRIVSRDATNEQFAPVKMLEVFEDVLPLCSEKFRNNGVELKYDLLQAGFQETINCCRVQLSQVFLNLLGNAFDAIENLDERWVEIKCERFDEKLVIRLIDSGAGIPMEIQDKIFRPFFTTKEIGKGTGLGLSLSYSIIQNHSGSFSIDNECKNTCFVIEFPIYGVSNEKAS